MEAKLPRKQKKAKKKIKCIALSFLGNPRIVLKDGVRHTKETIRLCNRIQIGIKRTQDNMSRVLFERLKKIIYEEKDENIVGKTFILPKDIDKINGE